MYKRQDYPDFAEKAGRALIKGEADRGIVMCGSGIGVSITCLLYTSDAADDLLCVDLGGRRIIKKKKQQTIKQPRLRYSITTTYATTKRIMSGTD